MRETCLGFGAAQADRQPRAFWKICAGFFEALAWACCRPDVYVKRVASRVLMQYATLAKGDKTVLRIGWFRTCFSSAPRLGQPVEVRERPALQAVRRHLAGAVSSRWTTKPRVSAVSIPLLAQARKRIARGHGNLVGAGRW
jgi:chemosensory pili system protein ChpA (sensor histidine kinase/response regulator)